MELIPLCEVSPGLADFMVRACRLLVVGELLGQAMLSAVGSCSQACKQHLSLCFLSLFLSEVIFRMRRKKMPLEVGNSQLGFHLISCGFLGF